MYIQAALSNAPMAICWRAGFTAPGSELQMMLLSKALG
jgi:hypothetical protein